MGCAAPGDYRMSQTEVLSQWLAAAKEVNTAKATQEGVQVVPGSKTSPSASTPSVSGGSKTKPASSASSASVSGTNPSAAPAFRAKMKKKAPPPPPPLKKKKKKAAPAPPPSKAASAAEGVSDVSSLLLSFSCSLLLPVTPH